MIEELYTLNAVCQNCDYTGAVNIRKGSMLSDALCPKCQCQTLIKVDTAERNIPVQEPQSISEKVSSDLGFDETRKIHDRKFGRVGVFKYRPF